MQSTRAKIIELLRERHETTVEELTRELTLAPATVRRHLDVLQRDGKVAMRAVRRPTGRPHFAFELTTSGEDELGEHNIRITSRLIEELTSLRRADTRGRSGPDLVSLVFKRLAQDLASACARHVTALNLNERLPQVLRALADEGLVFEVTPQPGGYLLQGRGCPCRRICVDSVEACVHDRSLLASLLDSVVEPAEADAAAGSCAYLVRTGVT